MARNSSSTSKAKPTSEKSQRRAVSPAEKQAKRNGTRQPAAEHDAARLFDDRTRRDIAGIACAILGIVLFAAMVIPTDAIVTSWVSHILHLALGLGAYILPFFLLVVAASFPIRFKQTHASLRITVGLTIIFIAFLTLLALLTPESTFDTTTHLFLENELIARGGYVGAGIAWVGLNLFGRVISCIIISGAILTGFIIIGFSLSKPIEHIRNAHDRLTESDNSEITDALPYTRIQRADQKKDRTTDNAKLLSNAKTTTLHSAPLSDMSDDMSTQVIKRKDSKRIKPAEDTSRTLTRKLGHAKPSTDTLTSHHFAEAPSEAPSIPRPEDGFELPSMNLLKKSKNAKHGMASDSELQETATCLREALESFQIYADVVDWVAGPTVTLFKVDLPAGIRVSRIMALEADIALALAAPGVRIFAPVPGTNYVGIEVPNHTRQTVLLGDVLKDALVGPLQIAIGKDVEGHSIISDLAKMPHLLIGGTTGSGKSVSINAMIMSILMRATPSEVRFIMIDPKRVEFTPYNGIPHLYVPVVTEPREAASALSWGVAEMERRLKVFSHVGARNIAQYNTKVQKKQLEDDEAHELPYIVIIIDELADLMMNVGKEVEFSISRIAQLARAAGIHLIVATQRPSTNVVTGLIKANITNRIAFNVASGIDSRVILDTPGAENLIGLGDLLLSKPELAKPQRIQGCYVSEDEINAVVSMLKDSGEPEYHSEILQTNLITLGASQPDGSGGSSTSDDPLIWEAADIVVANGIGSTSSIQRRLKVGYSRAGRIMDMLEEKGIVGPPNGSKPRDVLVDTMELETLKAFEANDVSNPKES